MKVDSGKFAITGAIVAGILWVICSLLIFAMPGGMQTMSGYMMHGDFADMRWQMGIGGLLFGLIGWSITGAVTCWLLATIYNKLSALDI